MARASEENYLKTIYKLSRDGERAGTGSIAEVLEVSASSVTGMIQRMHERGLLTYEKHNGAKLTTEGKRKALGIIRRHRLWEVFLTEKLRFTSSEVHEIAEELEHIDHGELIERLDQYLGRPHYDPHGDPIPAKGGDMPENLLLPLAEIELATPAEIKRLLDHEQALINYLNRMGLGFGTRVELLHRERYDGAHTLLILDDNRELVITERVAHQLLLLPLKD